MVRELDDDDSGGVNHSLIALLQERFRQLQKMKELREEKEQLKMLAVCTPPTSTHRNHNNYEMDSKKLYSGSEIFSPPKPTCQLSLSLWPDSSPSYKSPGTMVDAPSNLSKRWFNDKSPLVCTTSPMRHEKPDSDIDTSLRL